MVSGIRTSPETIAEIQRQAATGKPFRHIARDLGVGRDQVTKYGSDYRPKDGVVPSDGVREGRGIESVAPVAAAVNHDFAPRPDDFGRLHQPKLPDTVLVIPDLQFPFAHADAIKFLSMAAQRYKPDLVIGIGDEIDAYALSDFDKDPDYIGASKEYELALEHLDQLYGLFPRVLALHSNHGRGRLNKANRRAGYGARNGLDYHSYIKAPKGWGFYEEVIAGDVIFRHGDGERGLTKPVLLEHTPAEYGRHYSIVHGHVHEKIGRQATVTIGDKDYWCAHTGCLIDPYAHAFSYTKPRKAKLGCGLITHGEYKQLRLHRDDKNRWTGVL